MVKNSIPAQVKPIAYKINTWRYLSRGSTLLGSGSDCIVLCQYCDNIYLNEKCDYVANIRVSQWPILSKEGAQPDMT